MRLVNVVTLELEDFVDETKANYAILSHRWEGGEVTKQEFERSSPADIIKTGYIKVQKFCHLASADGHQYVWVDTCCIDKTSSAELSEAINSMFRWYANASMCYAYLSDVPPQPQGQADWKEFESSQWFTRGWTLQELLGPSAMVFLDQDWKLLGNKNDLATVVNKITKIPERVLTGLDQIDDYSIAQRMSWASRRMTTRAEDIAYSLMGLFNVNMPMLYGEGDRAFTRLQSIIIQQEHDHSVFAWRTKAPVDGGLLAKHPSAFQDCDKIVGYGTDQASGITPQDYQPRPLTITSRGIEIVLVRRLADADAYYVALDCADTSHSYNNRVYIVLGRTRQTDQFARAHGSTFFEDSITFPLTAAASYFHFRVPQPLSERRRIQYKSLKNAICVAVACQGHEIKDCKSGPGSYVTSSCTQVDNLWILDTKSEHANTFDAIIGNLVIRIVIGFTSNFDLFCVIHISRQSAILKVDVKPGGTSVGIRGVQATYGLPGQGYPSLAPPVMPAILRGDNTKEEEPFLKAFWHFGADRLAGCTTQLTMGFPLEPAGTVTITRPKNADGELVWHVHMTDIRSEGIDQRLDGDHAIPHHVRESLKKAGLI